MLKETKYTSQGSISFIAIIKSIFSDIPQANALGYQLFKRDIKASYRQSLLGFTWAFIPPMLTAIIWILLNRSGAVSLPGTDIPTPVYIMLGTLLWQVLSESITQPLKSVVLGKSILSKLNFPREALLLNACYTIIFNAFLKMLIIIAVLSIYKITPTQSMLMFPIYLIGIIITGMSIGILLTPLGMLYQDIVKALPFLMQFLMYVTPIIYRAPDKGLLEKLTSVNIFYFLIDACRLSLTTAHQLIHKPALITTLVSFGILVFGIIVYRFVMPIIVERVGS